MSFPNDSRWIERNPYIGTSSYATQIDPPGRCKIVESKGLPFMGNSVNKLDPYIPEDGGLAIYWKQDGITHCTPVGNYVKAKDAYQKLCGKEGLTLVKHKTISLSEMEDYANTEEEDVRDLAEYNRLKEKLGL